tara:strand:+ start:727 stop:1005 length:279 start_codon:yes stop_codon:yes gene_type:complete
MPKYFYSCKKCDHVFRIYHSIEELLTNCPECHGIGTLKRNINKVFIKKQETSNSKEPVGELTKNFIEDNREILKEYKEEMLNNEFDNKNTDS